MNVQSKTDFTAWPLLNPPHPRTLAYVNEFTGNSLNVRLNPLAGGFGAASNFKLEVADATYALRIMDELEYPHKELYAMQEAAAVGAAPAIRWTSSDGKAVLMDFIAGGSLTLEKGREPEIMAKVADLMRKVHALQKNPFSAPSFESQMEAYYEQHSQEDHNKAIWEEAIAIIKEGASQLRSLNAPSVNTHGDLNPRNILISNHDVYFIDWGDGTYADPFQDVAFFSIMMDYNLKEEADLIECYLGEAPTFNESARFQIAKRMNFARLVLSGQGIGNEISTKNECDEPLREWSYYAKVFADDETTLSAQFFWGQAQVALKAARALRA